MAPTTRSMKSGPSKSQSTKPPSTKPISPKPSPPASQSQSPPSQPSSSPPPPTLPTKTTPTPLPHALKMTYHIHRGEIGVLTFEPYKSQLLPHWRFKTASIAHTSSRTLYSRFLAYDAANDFVGMDMARKFIQMGFTRARRYANHRGGRKYADDGTERARDQVFEGKGEKEEAAKVFAEVLGWCRAHEGYREKKEVFLAQQRVWERGLREAGRKVVDGCIRGGKKEGGGGKNRSDVGKNGRGCGKTEESGDD